MINFFDKLEDHIREHLSRYPIIYSLIGGVGVVLFWRAVWETAEILAVMHPSLAAFFYPPVQLVLSSIILLLTGLMVSVFIGDRVILSGLRHEKKISEKTEGMVKEEVITLKHIYEEVVELKKKVDDLEKTTRIG